ncbi:uncharacterized protein LOC131671969 [Phymastichus coffea]|uniref:uncharacterized protein LOC131671969 n=1 Tax=Phymastichus coffea TaxID=108790 RepID=UPI00273AF946|nr:uncharacterized protein LOC131671969 [Phymastichus coffea]
MTEITASNPEVTYKSLRRNMLHGNRDVTDKYWSILFLSIVSIWIGSFGYVVYQGTNLRTVEHNKTIFEMETRINMDNENWFSEIYNTTANSISKYSRESWSSTMGLRMLICLLIMLCVMMLIRVVPKFCAHLAIAGTTLTIVSIISAIGMHLAKDYTTRVKPFREKLLLWITPELIGFVLCVSALVAMMYIGAFAMSEILRKSCRVFFFYRYSVFFGLFIFGIIIFILNFTIRYLEDIPTNNILFYTILGGSIYFMRFIYFFGRMVISMLAATHHWSTNKSSIPFTALFSAIMSVSKYHFGTVCFSATVILPPIVALFALCKSKSEPVQTFANRFIKFVFSVYLTVYIAEYSTIVTALHELNFYQSTKKTFHLLIKDCPRSLAFLRVFGTIVNIAIMSLFLADVVICAIYMQRNFPDLVISSITVLFTYILMSLPVYIVMDTITDTTVICVMNEDEDNIISDEKPPHIAFNGSAA